MTHRLGEYIVRQHDKLVGESLRDGADCPDVDTWALFADDMLSSREREQLVEHLARCPSCREFAGTIMSEQEEATVGGGATARMRSVFQFSSLRLLAMAAGVMLLIVAYRAFVPSGRPASTDALLASAEQQIQAAEHARARETLDTVLAQKGLTDEQRERARALAETNYETAARLQLARHDYAAARAELTEAMDRGYRSPEILRLRGEAILLADGGQPPAKRARLTALAFVGILDRRSKAMPADIPESNANQAIELLRAAADARPNSTASWSAIGDGYMSLNEFSLAHEAYAHWAEIAPQDSAAHNAAGLASYAGGDYAAAMTAFDKALVLAPDEPAYHMNAAMTCEELGRVHDAVAHWKRYLALAPAAPDADEVRQWLTTLERGIQ